MSAFLLESWWDWVDKYRNNTEQCLKGCLPILREAWDLEVLNIGQFLASVLVGFVYYMLYLGLLGRTSGKTVAFLEVIMFPSVGLNLHYLLESYFTQ